MPEAGWYEDPGQPGLRWWDGERWTADTAPLDSGTDPALPSAGMLGAAVPAATPSPRRSRGAGGRLPLVLGIAATVVVIAVVASIIAVDGGHHTSPGGTHVTSPVTAPNVASTTTTSSVPTATTVPGATGRFVSAVEGGEHPVTGYGGHASTLVGFGRTACAVLQTRAPATAAWYGAVTPSSNGTTAVPPLAGAALVAAAARYLCPSAPLVTRASRLATRVDSLPVALRRGGVAAATDEAAAGITAYACDLFLTGSTASRVTTELQQALHTGRYALSGHEAGIAASVGIQVVCPAHLPSWLRRAGDRSL